MSRSWVRRTMAAAATGAMVVLGLTLGGVMPGTAAAVVPTADVSSDLSTIPPAFGSVAHPASASAPMPGEAGKFNVFNNANFQGGFADLTNLTIPDLTAVDLNDLISSAANNSDTMMCMFTDANFMGQKIPFPPHTQIQQFDANTNDTVSSVMPC
jgi:hypothetical protein